MLFVETHCQEEGLVLLHLLKIHVMWWNLENQTWWTCRWLQAKRSFSMKKVGFGWGMENRNCWRWNLFWFWVDKWHLSVKEGSLFCFAVMRSTKPGCFRLCSWCLWKAVDEEEKGAWAWLHGVWTCGAKVLEYWMISSLKIIWNRRWKFRRNQNVPLVLLERSWWAGFNGTYLVRFGLRRSKLPHGQPCSHPLFSLLSWKIKQTDAN
jgi:hypothetical protein